MAAAERSARATGTSRALKLCAGLELLIARLDFFACEGAEAVHAEALATEAAHDAAVNDGVAQLDEIDLPLLWRDAAAGQVTDEAAGETIARSGGVEDLAEQVARRHEVPATLEEDGAELAALDDERAGSHVEDD